MTWSSFGKRSRRQAQLYAASGFARPRTSSSADAGAAVRLAPALFLRKNQCCRLKCSVLGIGWYPWDESRAGTEAASGSSGGAKSQNLGKFLMMAGVGARGNAIDPSSSKMSFHPLNWNLRQDSSRHCGLVALATGDVLICRADLVACRCYFAHRSPAGIAASSSL